MRKYFSKYSLWKTFILLVSLGNFVLGTSEISTYPHVLPCDKTRCGKILTGNTGGIFYQPFIQVLENERCVWQISVPGAKSYLIKFHYFGYNWENVSQREQGIVISSFSRHHSTFDYYPNTTERLNISDCNLLIVAFYSGVFQAATETTGFVLEYETNFKGKNTPEIAKESKFYNIGSKQYFVKHPSDGQEFYQKNELSTFLFLPGHNVFKKGTNNTVMYNKIGLINFHCKDRLKTYLFKIGTEENKAGWVYQGKICANTEIEAISSLELILIVFESDNN